MSTVPNIISGTVRRTARVERRTPNWLRAVYALIAGIVALVTVALIFQPASGDALKPCKYEGATHCYWDASTMGNGHGHDYVSR